MASTDEGATIDPQLCAAIRAAMRLRPTTRLLVIGGSAVLGSADRVVAHLALCRTTAWPVAGPSYAVAADLLRLPFIEALFDVIVAANYLERSPSPTAFLRELRRVAAPAATVLVGVQRRRWWHNPLSTHVYSRRMLSELISAAMFEVEGWQRIGGAHLVRLRPRGEIRPAAVVADGEALRVRPV